MWVTTIFGRCSHHGGRYQKWSDDFNWSLALAIHPRLDVNVHHCREAKGVGGSTFWFLNNFCSRSQEAKEVVVQRKRSAPARFERMVGTTMNVKRRCSKMRKER